MSWLDFIGNIGNKVSNLQSKVGNALGNALIGKQEPMIDYVDIKGVDVNSPEFAENMPIAEIGVTEAPRVGGLLNDIRSGAKENFATGFAAPNWEQTITPYGRKKGLGYRFGEGLGSFARFAESPLGRGLLMAGIVGASGGSGLEALGYGTGAGLLNQQSRMKDKMYRNELEKMGFDTTGITGYVGDDTFNKIFQSKQLQDNAEYRNALLETNRINQQFANQMAQDKLEYQKQQDAVQNYLNSQKVAQGWANVENNKQKANSGKIMPASSATGLSGTQQGINQMTTLMGQIPKYAKRGLAGPVGSLRRFNPYDADAQAFQQYVNTYKQVIGKGLEGGVLRKEDEAKYEKIIPRMGDTEEVLMRKAQQLQQMLIEKYNTDLEALYNAGYDTGNFNYYGLQSSTGNGKSGVTKSGVKYEVIE